MMIKRKCKYCNKIFYKHAYYVKRGEGLYCSRKCFLKGYKKPLITNIRICKTCQKKFITTLSMETRGVRKYCSRKCMAKGYSIGHNPHIQKKVIKVKCDFCRKKCFKIPSLLKISKHHFCSISCKNKFYCMGKELNQAHRKKLSDILQKKGYKANSLKSKKAWINNPNKDKMIKSILKGLIKRPTSLEKQMIDIIKRNNLPYKYTGDGLFLIGYKNPDFVNINGEKKLIEVGNTYHHDENYIIERSEHFAKYGWQSYIFLENTLNEENILQILNQKGGGSYSQSHI